MNRLSILTGDCRDILPTLEAGSVQTCITSPPYWGLRDYGIDGQLGLESTPEEYIANMVAVFREVWRVLRDDGTLWLNMGDSYAGSYGGGPPSESSTLSGNGHFGGGPKIKSLKNWRAGNLLKNGGNSNRDGVGRVPGLKPKDLCMMPARLAMALQADGWYLRSEIVWHKPNPMPESVTDRPTKAHEMIYLLAKQERYFYDAEAIREPVTGNAHPRGNGMSPKRMDVDFRVRSNSRFDAKELVDIRNKRTVWTIATQPFAEAHFATFPEEIPKLCILAGSKPGDTVLDPFAGSGTVGQVALELGRRAVLIELNPAYIELAEERTFVTPGFL
jgi:DNA modification methylase